METPTNPVRFNAIGNAQNAFVRTMLSNLGTESFSKKDWLQVVSEFGGRCAYCKSDFDSTVASHQLVMDHAVPINRQSLGEHRLGNLVPACHACNAAKGQKDYRDFCADLDALERIETHMATYAYVPIDGDRVQLFLETAYQEVRELSQRYLLLVNSLLPESGAGTALAEATEEEREGAERLLKHEPLTEVEEAEDVLFDDEE